MRQTIAYFTGLEERLGPLAGDASTAPVTANVSTDYGRLASAPGTALAVETPAPGTPTALYVFSDRVGGQTTEICIVGTTDAVYAYIDNVWRPLYTQAQGGDWGFLTYQRNEDTLLLFGNGLDPVQLWNGQSAAASDLPGAPARGRFFALHYERVWMCGDVSAPDRVYYSRAMDVTNWTVDVEIPDRAGGFVELPTFDGGTVTNLYKVGGDLVVLKSTTALLLFGTSPSSYQVVEMSGALGTIAGRSAAVAGQNGYFITKHGIGVQSGATLSLLDDRKLPRLFDPSHMMDGDPCQAGLSPHFGGCAVGLSHNERLFFSLPLGTQTQNSLLLEYDLNRQTYMAHTGLSVVALARAGTMRERLLLLNAQGELLWWNAQTAPSGRPALWVTPWLDFGTHAAKTLQGLALYGRLFSPGRSAQVRLTVESEQTALVRVLSPKRRGEELYRFAFRLRGRRFRIRIEALGDTGFCFTGGLELEVV